MHSVHANRSKILWGLFALACLRFLAVDLYPVITNDSIGYLDHSNNLAQVGLVRSGYRQVGYPFFLATIDWIGEIFRLEPLMLTALFQRLLLVGGLAYATWLFNFWSIPLLFVGTTPTFIAYTNFILTEGLAIPLAIVYACLLAHILQLARAENQHAVSPKFYRSIIIAAGLIYLLLVFIRSQHALLGTGIVGVAFLLYLNGGSERTWAVGLISAVTLAGLVWFGLVSTENRAEYGEFSPATRTERGSYWGAWSLLFRDPKLRNDPAVADLYADGDPYVFIRIVEERPGLELQRERFESAIDRLVAAADSSLGEQRRASFLGALKGGRLDDVGGIVKQIATAHPSDIDHVIHRNAWTPEHGVDVFVDQYNDGEAITPVIVSPLAPVRSSPYILDLLRFALPAAYVILILGVAFRATRPAALTALSTQLLFAVAAGVLLLDNVRYLMTPHLFTLTLATGVFTGLLSISARLTAAQGERGLPHNDSELGAPAQMPSDDE